VEDGMAIDGVQTLEGFADHAGCRDGVCFTSLDTGTVLHVQTRNSHYRLEIIEAPNKVLVTGGRLCPEPVEARLVGATTGCMVKTGWIGVGLRLEIRLGRDRVTTSNVEDITIEHERRAA
jgi:hypothetical protein